MRKSKSNRFGRVDIAAGQSAPISKLDRSGLVAIIGLAVVVAVTPGVIIKNAQWYYKAPVRTTVQLPPPPLPMDETRIPEHLLPLKNYCRIGDQYHDYAFSLAMYKRAKAISRTSVGVYVMSIPRPRPRPGLPGWSENVAKKVLEETEKVLNATKRAGRSVIDLAKRKVSGNGQRMILEPRTARMFLELERQWGEKLEVRWAFRDKKLNRKVGGANKSMHLQQKAVDIVHGGWSKSKMHRFVRLAYRVGFRGFGMGGNVIHLDTRGSLTSWNYGGNRYGLAYSIIRR